MIFLDIKKINIDGIKFIKKDSYYVIHRFDKYFRIGFKEAEILKDLINKKEKEFILVEHQINDEDLKNLLNSFISVGIIGNEQKEKKNMLFYKVKLFNPNSILDNFIKIFFSSSKFNLFLLFFSLMFITFGLICFINNFNGFTSEFLSGFKFKDYVGFYFLTILAIFLHELGHAISCKYFGGEVKEIGFLLIFFSPALYCDVSGIRLFENKREKIITLLAGIFVQGLIFSFFVCLYVFDIWKTSFCATFAIWNFTMIFSNIIPVIKLDGYWILSTIMDIPNLYEKSFKLVLHPKNIDGILFDEKELAKKNIIRIYGYISISFIFISIILGFSGLYYLYHKLDGSFKYAILVFEALMYSLILIFFVHFLYKIFKNKTQKG